MPGFWAPLGGMTFEGYEIRHGDTQPTAPVRDAPRLHSVLAENRGWQIGQTLALYPHGLFENSAVMRALFGRETPTLEDTLNGLADFVEAHFAKNSLMSLV